MGGMVSARRLAPRRRICRAGGRSRWVAAYAARDVAALTLFAGANRLRLEQVGAQSDDTLPGALGAVTIAALMLRTSSASSSSHGPEAWFAKCPGRLQPLSVPFQRPNRLRPPQALPFDSPSRMPRSSLQRSGEWDVRHRNRADRCCAQGVLLQSPVAVACTHLLNGGCARIICRTWK